MTMHADSHDPSVGALSTSHGDVEMVSHTGSTGVGQFSIIAALANMKEVSPEFGGKNRRMILPGPDYESAVDAIVFGAHFSADECCNAGSRIIVHEDTIEEVTKKVAGLARDVPLGGNKVEPTRIRSQPLRTGGRPGDEGRANADRPHARALSETTLTAQTNSAAEDNANTGGNPCVLHCENP